VSSAARQLACRLREQLADAPCAVAVEVVQSLDWASITFTGQRHRIAVTLTGQGAEAAGARFLERLIEADLPITGHIVADVSLLTGSVYDDGLLASLDLEAITITDEGRA
jgi:hypothetical protein